MRLSQIERPISAYADGLERAAAPTPAAQLRTFARLLNEFRNVTVADLCAHIANYTAVGTLATRGKEDETRLCELTLHLGALRSILAESGASALAENIRLLTQATNNDSVYLSDMLNALRRALAAPVHDSRVTEFIERLKTEMGSSAFEHTLQELKASSLKRDQIVEIARGVYGGVPKSTSKKAAIELIRKPHDARVSARRAAEAMGGRSAA